MNKAKFRKIQVEYANFLKEVETLKTERDRLALIVSDQNGVIIENQQKSASLDLEYNAKKKRNKAETKRLDEVLVAKTARDKESVASLKNIKKELQSGINTLKKDTVKSNKEKNKTESKLSEINKKLEIGKENLIILNNKIVKYNNMAKKAKTEKEKAEETLAEIKKHIVEERKKEAEAVKMTTEKTKELNKLIARADYLVRFEDHLRSFEASVKEWCKRLGIVYQKFQ